jgi:hypothetical protein
MMAHDFNLSIWRQREVDLCEFAASLVYKMSSRIAKATPKYLSQKKQKVILFIYLFIWLFETGFLCSPACPGTHSVDQTGLELRNPPASSIPSAGIKGVCHHARPN